MNSPVDKDVEAKLLNQRKCRRKPGEVPYPLHHSSDILNFDNWNTMFLTKCCRGLTMHQFESPPAVVLDLGCGSGYWALEAAKQWPESTIIGFDINDVQPRLFQLESHNDLARRVKWVHGNLLDNLPFPSDHFDLVRICGLGLAVPEDEWQYFLEDVSRVMKPGSVLEILEEDLIFPCSTPIRTRPRPPPITVDLPRSDSMPSSTYSVRSSATLLSSDTWQSTLDDHFDLTLRKKSSLTPLHEFMSEEFPPSHIPPSLHSNPPPSIAPTTRSSLYNPRTSQDHSYKPEIHPQDHTRLKVSWDTMLSSRFLGQKLITVLPFYLSSCFVDVQTHPTLQVPLPPNPPFKDTTPVARRSDESINPWDSPDIQFDLKPTSARRSTEDDSSSIYSSHSTPSWASVHLAKMVKSITACKESIWLEYEKLYGPELPPVTRTSHPLFARSQMSNSSAREGFDKAWANWESDMMDRMGVRQLMMASLMWSEPPGDRPDFRVWRHNLGAHAIQNTNASEELCRSLRGFVAWKPR